MSDAKPSDKPRIEIPRWLLIVCHIAVVAGGIALVWAHFESRSGLTWQLLVAALIALLPALLPVLGFFLGEVHGTKFYPIAIQGTRKVDGGPGAAPTQGATGPSPSGGGGGAFKMVIPPSIQKTSRADKLSAEERKVLRTLWKFQTELFGGEPNRRWGFKVGKTQHDYADFEKGASALLESGLIEADTRSLVFLTDAGIAFCREYGDDFRFGDFWNRFEAA